MTDDQRRGYLYGLIAYGLWGFFPLYFRLLEPATPLEILAQRIVWSVAFIAVILTVLRSWAFLRSLARRPAALAGIGLAACLIAVNWGTFIYAVVTDHVVEIALGYFINPLVTMLFGVVLLHERLRPWQWFAMGIGTLAVVVLTASYGRLPYIALTLAFSFGGYGFVKKRLGLPAAEGLFVESAALAAPALAYLAWLAADGSLAFGTVSFGHSVLLVLSGVATAGPLLLFAGAANRIPLVGLGILQYVAPILQLGIGVLLLHEPMPASRLVGFALVWLALIVFTVDGVRHVRGSRTEELAAV